MPNPEGPPIEYDDLPTPESEKEDHPEAVLPVDIRLQELADEVGSLSGGLREYINSKTEDKEEESAAENLLNSFEKWFALRFRPTDYGETAETIVQELTGREGKVLAWRKIESYSPNSEMMERLDEQEKDALQQILECYRDMNEEDFFEQAPYDPLTMRERIFRRHVFEERFKNELTRVKQIAKWQEEGPEHLEDVPEARRKSFILNIDINNLKEINDTHGHPAGDKIIKKFAHILRANFDRDSDVLARMGGDEFSVIARSGSLAKICNHLKKVTTELKGAGIEAGIGISEILPGDSDFMEESWRCAYDRADKASYEAKRAVKRRDREAEPEFGIAIGQPDDDRRRVTRKYIPYSEITDNLEE